MAPTAAAPAAPAGPAPLIQLRLSTRAAERLEALLEGGNNGDGGGLRAVIDESGGLAAVVIDGERFPVEGGREQGPWMQVAIAHRPSADAAAAAPPSKGKGGKGGGGRRGGGGKKDGEGAGAMRRMEEVGWVYAKAAVRVTAADRGTSSSSGAGGGLLPTPPLPPSSAAAAAGAANSLKRGGGGGDHHHGSESEGEGAGGGGGKKRRLKTIGLSQQHRGRGGAGGGGLLPAPSSLDGSADGGGGGGLRAAARSSASKPPFAHHVGGGGMPKATSLDRPRRPVDTLRTELWVAARVATLEVTGRELRDSLLRGVALAGEDPIRWLPTHEALLEDDTNSPNNPTQQQQQHGTCTLLCRFDKAEHASVALLRDGEAVQLGGGLGLVTVRLTPCSRTMLEEVNGFGLVLTGHKTVAELLASLRRALPAPAFATLRTTWARLVPSLRQGVPPPGSSVTDPEIYFAMLHSQYLLPLDHAALLLAATKQRTPQASKFVAPENRPPPLDADLALAALTTVRRGLQRWLSRIRGQWLAGHSNVPQLCEALLPPPVALVGGGGGENGREGGGKKAPVPVEKKEEDGGGGGGESDDSWDLDLG